MPINYDVEYPKLRMKYGKALQRIEKLEADLTLDKSWQQVEYATRTNLEQRIEALKAALNGIGGATVYRKSHEDVTKELEAVRRFARAALQENE